MNLFSFLGISILIIGAFARPQYNYPAPSQLPSGNFGFPSQTNIGITGNEVNSISTGSLSQIGGTVPFSTGGGVLVQKHIYVHVPPPDIEEERRTQNVISTGQSTKHYKIIFIKAPSAPAPTAASLALAAQNQEKTIIYVLVKKPEDAADITIPTSAPTQPSKPEVYFIKYKAKSEAVGGSSIKFTGGSETIDAGIRGTVSTGGSTTIDSGRFGVDSGIRPSSQYGPPGQSGPY